MLSLTFLVNMEIQSGSTYPKHGAILKHVRLITDHTVFIQYGDPLLGKLNSLGKTMQGNEPARVSDDEKTQQGQGPPTVDDLNSYLHQEAAVSDWNAFCTICL